MKLRTVLLAGVAVVVVGGGAGLWWLYSSRDALVKAAIERYGPQITGVTVKVKNVRLEPAEGKGAIHGLEVGNPSGYSAPRALMLGEARMTIDSASLTSNVIRIKEIVIDSPALSYERGAGGDNLTAIQKHVDAEVAKLTGSSGKQADSGSGRKFIVDDLYVRGAKVSYGGAATLAVPDLHLRDIGKKTNGASAGELVKTVWDSLTRSVTGLASRALDGIKGGAKGAAEGIRGLFK